jgi:hypothetical protein
MRFGQSAYIPSSFVSLLDLDGSDCSRIVRSLIWRIGGTIVKGSEMKGRAKLFVLLYTWIPNSLLRGPALF